MRRHGRFLEDRAEHHGGQRALPLARHGALGSSRRRHVMGGILQNAGIPGFLDSVDD